MAFDFGGALKKTNAAIGRLLQPGLVGKYIPDAITMLSHPDLVMLPFGETRDAYESIFTAVKAANLSALTEDQAEEISTRIWAFRTRCELECRNARKQAMAAQVGTMEIPAPPVAPIAHPERKEAPKQAVEQGLAPWVPTVQEELTTISARIPVRLHYHMKRLCIAQGISITSFITDALIAKLAAAGNSSEE